MENVAIKCRVVSQKLQCYASVLRGFWCSHPDTVPFSLSDWYETCLHTALNRAHLLVRKWQKHDNGCINSVYCIHYLLDFVFSWTRTRLGDSLFDVAGPCVWNKFHVTNKGLCMFQAFSSTYNHIWLGFEDAVLSNICF